MSKADIAVIITFTRKGLNKVNTNNIFGKGEVFILNTYTDNEVELLIKKFPQSLEENLLGFEVPA